MALQAHNHSADNPKARSLDHFLIQSNDLDKSASAFEKLGFHVRPRAGHEDLGSANHVVIFPNTYLELIFIGELPADIEELYGDAFEPYRKRLEKGDGFVHLCLTSDKLEPDHEWAQQQGLKPAAILSARRKVVMPDGSPDETASRSFYMWRDDNPYMSLFYADHPRPEVIFIPEYTDHPNTVTGVSRVVYMSKNPAADLAYFTALTGRSPQFVSREGFAIIDGRGDYIEVMDERTATQRYADALVFTSTDPFAGVGIAMHYHVKSLSECAAQLSAKQVPFDRVGDRLIVSASEAMGCIAVFEE